MDGYNKFGFPDVHKEKSAKSADRTVRRPARADELKAREIVPHSKMQALAGSAMTETND
ncbi:MAG: hypothetical protein AB7E85_03970 [Pseudobdellovibrionaceae bacterium]